MSSRLRAARLARGWSQTRLLHEIERRGQQAGVPVMRKASLRTAVSRWENGHVVPDELNRRLLREVYGLTDDELGLNQDAAAAGQTDEPAEELRQRFAASTVVDPELVTLLRRQTDDYRRLDRRLGAPVLLEQMRAHLSTLQQLLSHAVLESTRRPVTGVLADAAALAGWQALDVGAVQQAWAHFETAKSAAREASDPALLAHVKVEQCYALLDLGRPSDAVALVQEARAEGGSALPPLLTTWLHAAEAEAAAACGDETRCRRALEAASATLPGDEAQAAEMPYITLDQCHLARWRGHSLARLGDAVAIGDLQRALSAMEPEFTRARGSLEVDLAQAFAAAGEREAARAHAAMAQELSARTGSVRQRRRLAQIAA